MDKKTDTYKASMAELARQGRELTKEIDDFLHGDNSHMSREEYEKTQQMLMAKQQNAIEAFISAFGMSSDMSSNAPTTTLMQSEDIINLKRLAGITEANDNHNFDTMKKIVQLATNFMQNNKANATMTAKNIMFLADRIKDE
jgi:hypothetical protein